MATITFKAKAENIYHADESGIAYTMIRVPALARRHCDMQSFRNHPKYGSYANSDLFPNILKRIAKEYGMEHVLRLDRIPNGVTVNTSGFLATVTINVP